MIFQKFQNFHVFRLTLHFRQTENTRNNKEHAENNKEPKMAEGQKKGVRIVCISDTHTKHGDLNIPDGDILIHAGDFTSFGRLERK